MVRIEPADWGLLPAVLAARDSVNLSPAVVDALQARLHRRNACLEDLL